MRFTYTLRAAIEHIITQAEPELQGDASPGLLEASRHFFESKGNLAVGAFYALMAENNRYTLSILGGGA